MTDRDDQDARIAAGIDRLGEGGWTIGKLLFVLIGVLFSLVVLSPIMALSILSLFLTWTELPGLHWLGHAIEKNMTTPVLDAFIGAGERLQGTTKEKR